MVVLQPRSLLNRIAGFGAADETVWQVLKIDASDDLEIHTLERLMDDGCIAWVHDTLLDQVRELIVTRHPEQKFTPATLERLVTDHLEGIPPERHGTWVYYPWSKRLVHVLSEAEFRELRTSRNRNKVTATEQAKLQRFRLGIVGLSVGQATATTLALEDIGGEFRLADFDCLSLSNMNRLRAGVHEIGVNKAVITARAILEINPYLNLRVYTDGVTRTTVDAFFEDGGKLDLLFEECDDLQMKVLLRERARALGIPVLMETSDRGMLDIERFDLEPQRPLFHGLAGPLVADELAGLDTQAKVPIVLRIIGADHISPRMAASLVDIETTIKTWPQLASSVALGGALNVEAARRIMLDQMQCSGRFYVDLEQLVHDGMQFAYPTDSHAHGDSTALHAGTARAERAPGLPSSPANPGPITLETVRGLVHVAARAPSGGNAQPWRVHWTGQALHCRIDPERAGTWLDFRWRASYLAMGAFVENLTLVARSIGFETRLRMFPDANDRGFVCIAEFLPQSKHRDIDLDLVSQVPLRTTNRGLGAPALLSPALGTTLIETANAAGARLQIVADRPALELLGGILGAGDRLRILSAHFHRDMMSELRWSEDEAIRTGDGIDVRTLELTAADLAGLRLLAAPAVRSTLSSIGGGKGLERPSAKMMAGSMAAGMLSIAGNSPLAFFHGGRAMQRVWLRAGVYGIAFQPVTAIVYQFMRLDEGGEGLDSELQIALRDLRSRYLELFHVARDESELMLFRMAQAGPPRVQSLRRPLQSFFSNDVPE